MTPRRPPVPAPLPLDAHDLCFGYPGRPVLHGVSLRLHPGRVVALLGPNGSGKSTLLRVLLGLSRPAAGTVHLSGRPLAKFSRPAIARQLAYVPQHSAIAFAYTALEVVLMARVARQRYPFAPHSASDRALALDALARLGAASLAGRLFATLSGGERQLVLIARALAQETPVLVMDEPVTGLDYGHQIRLLALVRELARATGKAVLQTTHTPEHALASADEVILLQQGRIVARGEPSRTLHPATLARLYEVSESVLARYLHESRIDFRAEPAKQATASLTQ